MRKLLILLLFISNLSFAQLSKYDLVYTSKESGNHEIYLRSIDGKNKLKITNYELRDGYSSVSPDGQKIAFYAYHDNGKTWSIHTMDWNGENRTRLTNKKDVFDAAPQWSADGKLIIFSREEGELCKVMVMNADGSSLHQLNLPFALHPSFTKDSKVIFSTHWEANGEICIADSTGENLKQLTHNNSADGHPVLSYNGTKIVYYSEQDGDKEIYTMNLDGSNQKRLTFNKGSEWSACWSPDGSKIAYISDRNGQYDIFIINTDGTGEKNITNSSWSDTSPCWLIK